MLGRSVPGIQDGAKLMADRKNQVLERLGEAAWLAGQHAAAHSDWPLVDLRYTSHGPGRDLLLLELIWLGVPARRRGSRQTASPFRRGLAGTGPVRPCTGDRPGSIAPRFRAGGRACR